MKYSFADNLATVLQLNSQRTAAKSVGVNSRTLERWLAGSTPKPASIEKVRQAAKSARASMKRHAKLEQYEPIRTPVPVYGERRELNVYDKSGKPTGQTKESEWTNYRVDKLDFSQCLDILRQFRDSGTFKTLVQIIFMASPETESDGHRYSRSGDRLPEEKTEDIDVWTSKGSTIQSLMGMTDADLKALLRRYYRGYFRPGRINLKYISIIQT